MMSGTAEQGSIFRVGGSSLVLHKGSGIQAEAKHGSNYRGEFLAHAYVCSPLQKGCSQFGPGYFRQEPALLQSTNLYADCYAIEQMAGIKDLL